MRGALEHRAKKWDPVFRTSDATEGSGVAPRRQRAHPVRMERATKRPKGFRKPANWTDEPAPKPAPVKDGEELSPTRYGDWTVKGVAVDF